jgi:hypothetical protein
MKNSKNIERILLLFIVFIGIFLVSGFFPSSIYGNQETKRPWLEQFENGPVTVTFITAPPEKEKIIDARLISVETCGLVLRLPKDRNKFFPYANIISVDPK